MMETFNKAELIKMRNGIEYMPSSVNMDNKYLAECALLIRKLNRMIEEYCNHPEVYQLDCGDDKINYCNKCKTMFKD